MWNYSTSRRKMTSKSLSRDVPGDPVLRNLHDNAGDAGLIPGQGTKTPHAREQLTPCTAAREPEHHSLRSPRAAPRTPCTTAREPEHHSLRSPRAEPRTPCIATKTDAAK